MNTSLSLPSGMFWQIFRKDWRLLWPLAVASAVIQADGVLSHPDVLGQRVDAITVHQAAYRGECRTHNRHQSQPAQP